MEETIHTPVDHQEEFRVVNSEEFQAHLNAFCAEKGLSFEDIHEALLRRIQGLEITPEEQDLIDRNHSAFLDYLDGFPRQVTVMPGEGAEAITRGKALTRRVINLVTESFDPYYILREEGDFDIEWQKECILKFYGESATKLLRTGDREDTLEEHPELVDKFLREVEQRIDESFRSMDEDGIRTLAEASKEGVVDTLIVDAWDILAKHWEALEDTEVSDHILCHGNRRLLSSETIKSRYIESRDELPTDNRYLRDEFTANALSSILQGSREMGMRTIIDQLQRSQLFDVDDLDPTLLDDILKHKHDRVNKLRHVQVPSGEIEFTVPARPIDLDELTPIEGKPPTKVAFIKTSEQPDTIVPLGQSVRSISTGGKEKRRYLDTFGLYIAAQLIYKSSTGRFFDSQNGTETILPRVFRTKVHKYHKMPPVDQDSMIALDVNEYNPDSLCCFGSGRDINEVNQYCKPNSNQCMGRLSGFRRMFPVG